VVVVVVFVVVLLLDDSSAKTDADTVQRQITTAALKLCIFRLTGTLEKKLKTQRFAFAELIVYRCFACLRHFTSAWSRDRLVLGHHDHHITLRKRMQASMASVSET